MRARSQLTGWSMIERRLDRPLRPGGPQLGDDLLQHRPQARLGVEVELKAAAEAPAGEIEHVVDELGHPRDAALDEAHDRRPPAAERFLLEHAHAGVDRGERVAQIVAEHGDELLAQLRRLALVEERRLGRRHPLVGLEVEGDEVGEQPEHLRDLAAA